MKEKNQFNYGCYFVNFLFIDNEEFLSDSEEFSINFLYLLLKNY